MIGVVILLVIIGVCIHLIKRDFYVYYYIILFYLLPYFLTLLLHLEYEDNTVLTNYSPIYLMAIFVIEIIRNKLSFKNKSALLIIILLFIYVTGSVFMHGVPFIQYLLHFFVSFLAPLFCLSNLFYWIPPNRVILNRVITLLFVSNLILFYIQHFSGLLVPDYAKDNEITFNEAAGTFSSGASYASFMLVFLCYFLFAKSYYPPKKRWLIIFVTVLSLLLTGVRTYLVCSIIFIPICLLLLRRKKINPIIIICVGVLMVLPFAYLASSTPSNMGTGDAENAIQRQVYGITKFSRGESSDEKSTLFLSAYVFSEHFVTNPFFGNWKLYTPLSYDLVSPENLNVMDAGIAVYLSDIGFFGMFLYVLFQVKTFFFNVRKERKRWVWLFYGYALITTYTDIGIFGGALMCSIFMVTYLINDGKISKYDRVISVKGMTNKEY